MDNKRSFTVKVGDKDVTFDVRRPNHKVKTKSDLVYARALKEATDEKVPVQAAMERTMQEQGLWTDEKRTKFEECHKRLLEAEKKLLAGGNAGLTKSAARQLALEMRRDRIELRLLTAERNQLFQHTAEAIAEQARFNYYVSACTVYEKDGKPYFKSVDDYLARCDENDPVAPKAAEAVSNLLYGLEEQKKFVQTLPENRFLEKYGFANKEGHLIDSQGRLINADNRLVNKDGELINEQGELVDETGNLIAANGEPKVEFSEFLDEPDAA